MPLDRQIDSRVLGLLDHCASRYIARNQEPDMLDRPTGSTKHEAGTGYYGLGHF